MKNYIIKFLLWLAKTFEDSKGNPSSRRITGFWVTGLLTIVVLVFLYMMFKLTKGDFPMQPQTIQVLDTTFKLVICLCLFVLILFGIITSEQFLYFVKGKVDTTTITQSTKVEQPKNESETPPPPVN